MRHLICLVLLFSMITLTCSLVNGTASEDKPIRIELQTSLGPILLKLSNKTPQHRDNFLKIIQEGRLDSMIFHRVLEGFVVQAGEYDSLKTARMDSSELQQLDYRIPAEFDPALFHKRGALAAARTDNPDRASSSLSFYIVQRGARSDSLLDVDQGRINGWLQKHYFLQDKQSKIWRDSLQQAELVQDEKRYAQLQDTISLMAKSFDFEPYHIPDDHREVYKTLGGTAHLDQNYSVFGEVIQGMEVVDAIAAVGVDDAGRPFEEVYILSARVLD